MSYMHLRRETKGVAESRVRVRGMFSRLATARTLAHTNESFGRGVRFRTDLATERSFKAATAADESIKPLFLS